MRKYLKTDVGAAKKLKVGLLNIVLRLDASSLTDVIIGQNNVAFRRNGGVIVARLPDWEDPTCALRMGYGKVCSPYGAQKLFGRTHVWLVGVPDTVSEGKLEMNARA